MIQSIAKIASTSFLDGFALCGLLKRLRWHGAPLVGFAPSVNMDESDVAFEDRRAAAAEIMLELQLEVEKMVTAAGLGNGPTRARFIELFSRWRTLDDAARTKNAPNQTGTSASKLAASQSRG